MTNQIPVNNVEYHVGDIVLIHYRNKFGDLEDKRDPKNFWLGQVHKFKKAEDEDCVALVAWLYWPSDLEGPIGVDANGRLEKPKNGAKGYHGEHELIASNHLELVSIYSFEGNFTKDVEKYDETDDNKVIRQYYYRQTFDLRTQRLSVSPLSLISLYSTNTPRTSAVTAFAKSTQSPTRPSSNAPTKTADSGTTKSA